MQGTRPTFQSMGQTMVSFGFPREALPSLPDMTYSALVGYPVLSLDALDGWLHAVYGDYEAEGKSMSDMVRLHFKEDAPRVASFFDVCLEVSPQESSPQVSSDA